MIARLKNPWWIGVACVGMLLHFTARRVHAQQLGAAPEFTPATLRSTLVHGPPVAAEVDPGRSVPLAFGLSALVPGAGQAYNRHWIKAAVAVALEGGVLFARTSWRSRGHRSRDEYRHTAHQYWSPVQYALWLNDYRDYLNTIPGGTAVTAGPVEITGMLFAMDLTRPGNWTIAEQLAVQQMIAAIQRLETHLWHPETGARFSHVLPLFGEQQYYELVGKYYQFAPGWSDYRFLLRDGLPTWVDADGNFIASIDPETTGPGGSKPHVSARFYAYGEIHAKANDYLRRASRVTVVLFANHFLAALDAAISARLHNNRLQARLDFFRQEPVLTMRLTF